MEQEFRKNLKVATIGGGTGHFELINAVKTIVDPELITAIPGTSDNGGSSGRLITVFGVLPPGDVRQCILALAPDERQVDLANWLNFRFPEGIKDGGLEKHNLGNLNIAALEMMYGSQGQGIDVFMKILNIPGHVRPVSHNKVTLKAILTDDSEIVGETEIDKRAEKDGYDPNIKIKKIIFNTEAYLNPNAKEAIEEADWIVIAPGDLYTSILPNLLINGMASALMLSKAKLVYCGNLLTKAGETDNFKASDCLREIKNYLGDRLIDHLVFNKDKYWPPDAKDVLEAYQRENKYPIQTDLKACRRLFPQAQIHQAEMVKYIPSQRIVRHNRQALAEVLNQIFRSK